MLRHLPAFISACLVIALLYSSAGLVEILRPQPNGAVPTAQVESTGTSQHSDQALPSPVEIAKWHLFGHTRIAQQAPAVPITAPDTKLNLKLYGVIASDGIRTAGAIIEDSAGIQKYYVVGDQLPEGAELKEVHPDRVILLRNNRYETLRMPVDMLQSEDITPATSMAVPQDAGKTRGFASNVGSRLQQ